MNDFWSWLLIAQRQVTYVASAATSRNVSAVDYNVLIWLLLRRFSLAEKALA